jgi:hypothetical protein
VSAPDRMGAAQAAVIHAQLARLHGEVTHWQAAHPDADDLLVNTLEYHLRMAVEAAWLIVETRQTARRKEDR